MTVNVRCAGGLVPETRTDPDGEDVHIGSMTTIDPCGWRGERGRTIPSYWPNSDALIEHLTRKSCPRCGGKVELIGGAP